MKISVRNSAIIEKSKYISRDLSWLKFNDRVLDQASRGHRNVFERMRFLAISDNNLNEYFMIRVGSLYNYIDFQKKRLDYSGLREEPFRKLLLKENKRFRKDEADCFQGQLRPLFQKNGFEVISYADLKEKERIKVEKYFNSTEKNIIDI